MNKITLNAESWLFLAILLLGLVEMTPVNAASGSTNMMVVNNAPTLIITPSGNSINVGSTIFFTANIPSGGQGPFTVNLIYNGNVVATNTISSSGNTATLSFTPSTPGSPTFNVIATDQGTTPPYVFNSIGYTIEVSSIPGGPTGGGGGPSYSTLTLTDNVSAMANSNAAVFKTYIVNPATRSIVSNGSFYQNQLPASVQYPNSDMLNFSFACSFTTGSVAHYYQNDVYGLGFNVPCGRNYTLSGAASYTVIYNSSSAGRNASTTTVTTTVPTTTTTTIEPTTTVQMAPVIVNVDRTSLNTTVRLCRNASESEFVVNYASMGSSFAVTPRTTSCFALDAINVTELISSTQPQTNFTALLVINVTSSNRNVSINATLSYPCGIPASRIAPFILTNGTWKAIVPFAVNAATCTVNFLIPADPVIAVFESTQTAARQTQSTQYLWVEAVLALIVLLALLFLVFRRRRKKRKRPGN